MEVMAWSEHGYKNLVSEFQSWFMTGMAPELILPEKINLLEQTSFNLCDRFIWEPHIIGRRGTDGSSFNRRLISPKKTIKTIRNTFMLPYELIKQRF